MTATALRAELQAVVDAMAVGERYTVVKVNAALGGRFGTDRTGKLLRMLERRGLVESEFPDGKFPKVWWRA